MAAVDELTTADAILEVEEQMSLLARWFRASMRQAAIDIDPSLPPFGLKLLRLLSRCGVMHASAAAELLGVDRSVISRHVSQLEKLGLIEFRTDSSDGRARFLALTPIAVERMDSVGASGTTLMYQTLSSWSTGDLRQFAEYIARLNAPEA